MTPHAPIREAWLALADEPVLDPAQPILDAHHHLWDRTGSRYRTEAFLEDAGCGHDVRASLYVQCRTGYRTSGPESLQPLGEVDTILEWSASAPNHPVGIVAFADLMMGHEVRNTLDALLELAPDRVCGIRNTTAYHPDPAVRSNPQPARDGLLRSEAFRQGAAEVARAGLVLDVWAYQTQLHEIEALARQLPELTIVIDHCGGPLGVGPFRHRTPADFAAWRAGIETLAALPNTRLKIGGFGLAVFGNDYHQQAVPPLSRQLATDWSPWFEVCLEAFGADRCMLESNFPVDKGMFSYVALWNAFKRLTRALSQKERDQLFWKTAASTYRVAFDERTTPHGVS
ncbi:Predicted metal-dependent hydrolase, TIM-barrel fold [Kushneria avicenniae]|uniref:Predicted metal-dependent hydrolase, TIM-barrel fold n=1 Tax=Kushneria avicenniae TaxID=402385 RepID=A0A1I1G361_9GAMM|nr:amidohydrolase family protein [Kushneria avicenniae]SFC05975.1 Predicted metal-dependent hydrolase, TIM-barrel fold [Kushneria avicenniae]